MIGSDSMPAFARSSPNVVSVPLTRAGVAELADEELRVSLLSLGDAVEDGLDLVDRLVLVAADLEVDERRVTVLRDLAAADVLHGRHRRDARRRRPESRGERGIARPQATGSGSGRSRRRAA